MTGSSATEKTTANNPLEQFVLLAKTAKGAAAVELIKQAVEAPGVNVFGELLDMPNIKELERGAYAEYWNTLNLFAYGTYKEYLSNREKLFDLTPTQKKKLQHLTIVTLATKSKCIPYSVLLQELDVKNVRDLEDLIIEAVYADIIHGKLDQKNSQLEVDYAGLGRDVRPEDTGAVAETLAAWGQACDAVLACIEQQVLRANGEKQKATHHKEKIQQDVSRRPAGRSASGFLTTNPVLSDRKYKEIARRSSGGWRRSRGGRCRRRGRRRSRRQRIGSRSPAASSGRQEEATKGKGSSRQR